MITESWTGKHNLMVIPLRDFEIVLEINFLRRYRFGLFPYFDGMMIMEEANPSFIKVVYPYGETERVKYKTPHNIHYFYWKKD